jgi:hypothetical protein
MREKMTIDEATKQQISELRLPFWADPEAHIELYSMILN